jgi:hypothetical protein
MYFRANERSDLERFGGLAAAAVAVPMAGGITLAMLLEAVAFVLSALAAAYLLIRAYEAARASGFGVAMAQRALTAGLGKLVGGARKVVEILRHFVERARRIINPRPDCAAAIAALEQVFAELESVLGQLIAEARSPVPRIPELRMLMGRLGPLAERAGIALGNVLRVCGTLPSL